MKAKRWALAGCGYGATERKGVSGMSRSPGRHWNTRRQTADQTTAILAKTKMMRIKETTMKIKKTMSMMRRKKTASGKALKVKEKVAGANLADEKGNGGETARKGQRRRHGEKSIQQK